MRSFCDRVEIIRNLWCVDAVVPQENMDKLQICKRPNLNVMFVGDDWYKSEKRQAYEQAFAKEGIKIVYFPYTKKRVLHSDIQGLDLSA